MAEHAPSYLGQILDAVADPIFVKDKEHRWVYVNAAFCRFLGYTREELLGRSDFDFIPQAEAQVFWEKDDEVFRTGVTLENEECFTGSDGTTKIISTKKARFVTPEGEEVLVIFPGSIPTGATPFPVAWKSCISDLELNPPFIPAFAFM